MTEVFAHRGFSGKYPENTLRAFEEAINIGADGIELDIQLSKDGEIVVLHDETIDRTSDGTGYVRDYTYEELSKMNFNVLDPEMGRMKLPLMKEVFELIRPTNMKINIELKTGIYFYDIEEKIVALTKEYGMEKRVIYSSFNHESIRKIREIDPEAECAFLFMDGLLDMEEYAVKHHVEGLHPVLYHLQYPDFVKKCKEKGIAVRPWTVNEEEYMKLCFGMGVDAIITNYPDVCLALRAKL